MLSSSKRTKHINVRYYFIKDKIKKEEINVIYCPTSKMVGDFFTKPLRGPQFTKFRNAIMGVSHPETIAKECVVEIAAQQPA